MLTDIYIFDDCTAAINVENFINNNCSCLRIKSAEAECTKKSCNADVTNAEINPNITNIGGQICNCNGKELSIDLEGIKLDVASGQ